MKKFLLTIVAALIVSIGFSQVPESFQYQAVARDASGNILSNQSVGLEFKIRQGVSGPSVYTETFTPATDTLGIITIGIGTGTPSLGVFTSIDWSTGVYFLEVSMDETGGSSYVSMGITQLLSVPYALYSKQSETSNTANTANSIVLDTLVEGVDFVPALSSISASAGGALDLNVNSSIADYRINGDYYKVWINGVLYNTLGSSSYLGAGASSSGDTILIELYIMTSSGTKYSSKTYIATP